MMRIVKMFVQREKDFSLYMTGNRAALERNLRRQGFSDFNTSILDGEYINLPYVCCVICFTKESCVEWMKRMELIATSMKCPLCNNEMVTKTVLCLSDGVIWYCPKIGENKKSCGKRRSWMEKVKITLEQILIFSYLWVNKYNRRRIVSETGISSSIYGTCDKFLRRICEEILTESDVPDDLKKSSSHKNSLDGLFQIQAQKDTFVEFLKAAAYVHQKGAAKCAADEEKK